MTNRKNDATEIHLIPVLISSFSPDALSYHTGQQTNPPFVKHLILHNLSFLLSRDWKIKLLTARLVISNSLNLDQSYRNHLASVEGGAVIL